MIRPASEQRLLIIETSSRAGQVALAIGGEVRRRRRLDEARRHARDLAPAVRELLAEARWRPAEIAAVLVSRGPGSYTGLRVGIMSAKAFAYATGCRIIGVETFAAIALQAADFSARLASRPSTVAVIADAQQQQVYSQLFELPGDAGTRLPSATAPVAICPLREWMDRLPADALVSGPGLWVYRDRLPASVRLVAETFWDSQPESLLALGLDRLARGEFDDVMCLDPLYLRASSAEETWQRKQRATGEHRQ